MGTNEYRKVGVRVGFEVGNAKVPLGVLGSRTRNPTPPWVNNFVSEPS